jgi:transposase-like protein
VSRITEGLAEEVESYFRRPLTRAYPYLFLDATFLDARLGRCGREHLGARGLRRGGKRGIASFWASSPSVGCTGCGW